MNSMKHLSIIMDGNGRWAKRQGLNRSRGHFAGARIAFELIKDISSRNISTLSLFTFSKENWTRPTNEVNTLMRLLAKSLDDKTDFFRDLGIKLTVIGDRNGLPQMTIDSIARAEAATDGGTKMKLILAVNYSGQYDICQAIDRRNQEMQGRKPTTPEDLQKYLLTAGLPNPDLIIRTGGESRLSNFYLWQSAYSEIHFNDKFWPDFSASDLDDHLGTFFKSERRFGAIC